MVKYAPRKVYIRESGGYVELSYTGVLPLQGIRPDLYGQAVYPHSRLSA